MEHNTYREVGKPVRKKDAMQLLLGKPVYMDDITQGPALWWSSFCALPTPTPWYGR